MESSRLFFREIEEDDSAFIVDVRSDPEVYRYFVDPHRITLEEHLNWFRNIYPHNDKRTDYIAVDKASGERAGVFGLIKDYTRIMSLLWRLPKSSDLFKPAKKIRSYILRNRYDNYKSRWK